ncbi:butyrophilin subfamily 3 member A2-like [Embiotoca jacksoni]|uniref:butyrophilin subfamily 3 member A2-like n=1 Tax=Embiotoca jacksoni TaxID=100190 RepID=UPI003703F185
MFHRLFLNVILLVLSGDSSVRGQPEQVVAFAGRHVVLPCSFNITEGSTFPVVEWSKEGLEPNVVFLYRDGRETHEEKNSAFMYRSSLIAKELKNGNVSLRIANLRTSDGGMYKCMKLWMDAEEVHMVELVVVAVSDPKLRIVRSEDGGVTLECEARCWQPQPDVRFLDDGGNDIPADDPERKEEAGGCLTTTRVTRKSSTTSVTCRVHLSAFNQTRDAVIFIPADCMRSSTSSIAIVVGATLVSLLVVATFSVLWWKCCRSMKKGSVQSPMSDTCEKQVLLDNDENTIVEELNKKVADLEKRLQDEIIRQYRQPTIPGSCLKSTPDVSKPREQRDNSYPETSGRDPKPSASTSSHPSKTATVPQRKAPKFDIQKQVSDSGLVPPILRSHSFSGPAGPSSPSFSTSTAEKNPARIQRSMSESCAQRNHNGPPQRRNSVSLPTSALSTNRYHTLENLPEE